MEYYRIIVLHVLCMIVNSLMIPSDIIELQNIEILALVKNEIKELPKELFELSHLKELYINSNKIEHVSSDIAELKELKTFTAQDNPIRVIPSSLFTLTDLYRVGFSNGSRVTNLKEGIILGDRIKLMNFCRKNDVINGGGGFGGNGYCSPHIAYGR